MTTAVLAHFDPQGLVARHVMHHIHSLREIADQVIVVSTASLESSARDELSAFATLIERPNAGYDFGSWAHVVTPLVTDRGAEELILCNDSTVGPLRPYPELFAEVAARSGGTLPDVVGSVLSFEIEPHLQSFFLRVSAAVVATNQFRDFWLAFEPVMDRAEVVQRYEIGLSKALVAGGFTLEPIFAATPRDRATSAYLRNSRNQKRSTEELESYVAANSAAPQPSNLMIGAWDAALTGRLPWIKLETLRDDPYQVGAGMMIAALSERWPEKMSGTAELIDRTRSELAVLRGTAQPTTPTESTPVPIENNVRRRNWLWRRG